MYTSLLHSHNLFRWLLLIVFFLALIFAIIGWMGKNPWKKRDNLMGLLLSVFIDIQLVIGLVLYFFLSPLTKAAFADFGAAMKNDGLRFFAVEHIVIMLIAAVLVHIGRIKSKRATADWKKHRAAAIWYLIALFILMHGIPWDRAMI
jgi:hypothetical protein